MYYVRKVSFRVVYVTWSQFCKTNNEPLRKNLLYMYLFADDSLSIINQWGMELKGEEEGRRGKQERGFLEKK